MHQALEEIRVQCPYCWERFEILVDCSEEQQDYIEDCFVCCRPINFSISIDESGEVSVRALSDDD